MSNPTLKTVNTNSTEGMPRREFIRKSLIASGGAFAGMAVGDKMALPELYSHSSTSSSSGSSDDGSSDGNWCWWGWCY